MLIKGWPTTDIDRTGMDLSGWPFIPTGIDPIGGRTDPLRNFDIGGGEPQGAASLIAVGNLAADFKRPGQHLSRDRHPAAGKGSTNSGTADRLDDSVSSTDQAEGFNAEPGSLAGLTQEGHIAFSMPPKMEVIANDDMFGMEPLDEDSIDKGSS